MKTTFVLGAGASKGIGYPLANDLGAGLLSHLASSSNEWFESLADFLIVRFGQNPDIEDLLENIEIEIAAISQFEPYELKVEREALKNARLVIGYGLIDWFRAIRENPAPNYTVFANQIVASNDSIITFNYDDSLERELVRADKWSVGKGYGFDLDSSSLPSKTTVLKLHGSMNWLASLFGGRTHGGFLWNGPSLGTLPTIHKVDLEFLECGDFNGRIFAKGVAFPLLILPYKDKKFGFDTSFGHEYGEFWNLLWTQASDHLNQSDRVIVIGYSMLPIDQRARSMILERTPKGAKVEIVCGSHSRRIADEFRAHGHPDPVAFEGYFSDWLRTQLQQ